MITFTMTHYLTKIEKEIFDIILKGRKFSMVGLAAVFLVLYFLDLHFNFTLIFSLIALELFVSWMFDKLLNKPYGKILLYLQYGIDFLVLLIGINYTGGSDSPLLPFLVAVPLSAGIISWLFTLITSIAVIIIYLVGYYPSLGDHTVLNILYPSNATEFYFLAMFLGLIIFISYHNHYQYIRNIEEKNRFKKNVITRVTHDTKNLLNIIGLTADLLKLNEGQKSETAIYSIKNAQKQINTLINDLKYYYDNEEADLVSNMVRVDIPNIISECIKIAIPHANSKNIEIIHDMPSENITAIVDENKLKAIINNLIDNAIKYNEPNGKVRINYEVNDTIKIFVTDSGIGIAKENLETIFKKGFRINKNAEKGTGSGLYIVKELTENINGNIDVKSNEKEGTTFTLTLPR